MKSEDYVGNSLAENDFVMEEYIPTIFFDSNTKSAGLNVFLLIKRIYDVLLSVFSLIMLLPLFIIVSIAIKCEDHGKIFYTQTRIGKNLKPFKIYKFRSMCVNADEKLKEIALLNERDGPVFKVTNDPRITKVGKFIRKTCIDELPQLINILRGDMSIVGPRPPLPNEVEQYTNYQKHRLDVRPGLTCYWQVSKHSSITFAEWVELDLKYIRNQSMWVDIKIIFETIKVVLRCNGEG